MILFYFKFENNLFPQTNVNLKLMMETNDPFPHRYLNKLRRKKNLKSHCLKCFSSSYQRAETKVVKLRFSLHFQGLLNLFFTNAFRFMTNITEFKSLFLLAQKT